jgi:hypothetical protein
MTINQRRKHLSLDFGGVSPSCQNDGTVTSGTAGETNTFTVEGVPFEQFVIGTQTTLTPAMGALGLDIVQTDTNGQGQILVPYSNNTQSPVCMTIGTTPAFYAELVVQVTDWSGCQLMFGFEGGATLPALTATFADYTDKASIGNYAGGALDVYTSQTINNAGDVDTDTAINLTDGDVAKLRVNVSAAGVVTYALSLAATATPTTFVSQTITTTAQTFDSGDVVVPFIYHKNHTDTATAVTLRKLTVGLQ